MTHTEKCFGKLDVEVHEMIERRRSSLSKEVDYLLGKDDGQKEDLKSSGWTRERLEVICLLNSFFYFVLGPLSGACSASVKSRAGKRADIHYGNNVRITEEAQRDITRCLDDFRRILTRSGVSFRSISAPDAYSMLKNLMEGQDGGN